MKRKFALLLLAPLTLAACGSGPKFHDKAKFELAVANRLGLASVSCEKTSKLTAVCTDPAGYVYIIACRTVDEVGGHTCSIEPKKP